MNNQITLLQGDPSEEILQIVPFVPAAKKSGYARFEKVGELPGLWRRNNRFYGQLSIPGKGCRRIALLGDDNEAVQTVQQAADALHELQKKNRNGVLPAARRTAPRLAEFATDYLVWVQRNKKFKTYAQEKSSLKRWAEFAGTKSVSQITLREINEFVVERQAHEKGPRGINVDVLVLSNLLRHAKDLGLTGADAKFATDGWKPLRYKAPKRQLITQEELNRFCAAAVEKRPDGDPRFKNGQFVAGAVRFMTTSGARSTSALAQTWSGVDWARRQVRLCKTKHDRDIVVDFNDELEALLKDLQGRRQPGDAVFPVTRAEGSVGSLRKSFEKIRAAAGLPDFRFHDCRHYFLSWCLLSGIDHLTAANWAGHTDGGVLVGRTYGHLNDSHRQSARKLSFSVSFENREPSANGQIDLRKVSVAELIKALQQHLQKTTRSAPGLGPTVAEFCTAPIASAGRQSAALTWCGQAAGDLLPAIG
jgi:integrase